MLIVARAQIAHDDHLMRRVSPVGRVGRVGRVRRFASHLNPLPSVLHRPVVDNRHLADAARPHHHAAASVALHQIALHHNF